MLDFLGTVATAALIYAGLSAVADKALTRPRARML